MIRFKLRALIEKKEFETGKKISVKAISEGTGIGRTTLSKILNQKGTNTTIENIDRLCSFFECSVDELIEYHPDDNLNS